MTFTQNSLFDFPLESSFTSQPLMSVFKQPNLLAEHPFTTIIKSRGNAVSRTINHGDLIACYRNLNKPNYFSAQQLSGEFKNKVAGYSNIIVLENPVFKVSSAGQKRVKSENKKNVHSTIRGTAIGIYEGEFSNDHDFLVVTYNPYFSDSFFIRETKELISDISHRYAILSGANVYLTDYLSF
jgi:hypothetical protein